MRFVPRNAVVERSPTQTIPVRLSIFVKQVSVYLLLILLVIGVTARLFFSTARGHLEDEIGRRLEYVARIAARYTPVERLELIQPGDDRTRMVLRLEQKLGEIREATGVRALYVFRPDRTSLLNVDRTVPVGTRYVLPQLPAGQEARLDSGRSLHSLGYEAGGGELRMSAFAPVRDEKGALIAIVGVDAGTRELAIVERMRHRLYWISGVCGMVALLAALLFARSITGGIRHIVAVAERLGVGAATHLAMRK